MMVNDVKTLKEYIDKLYNQNEKLRKELFKWACDPCNCYDKDDRSYCKKVKCQSYYLLKEVN